MIMLIGLVTKNGILIVEFANQKRKAGMNKMEAVIESAHLQVAPDLNDEPCHVLGRFAIGVIYW